MNTLSDYALALLFIMYRHSTYCTESYEIDTIVTMPISKVDQIRCHQYLLSRFLITVKENALASICKERFDV